MRMEVELELPDAPGQLAVVLELFAEHGANVLSVVHRHEMQEDSGVPVVVAVDVPEENAIRLINALASKTRLLRVDQEGGPARTSVILSGHVFQARIDALLEPVFETGADVERVDARIAGRDSPSAVLVDLSAQSQLALDQALNALRQAAADAELAMMDAIGRDDDA